jgi:hypothetical protein
MIRFTPLVVLVTLSLAALLATGTSAQDTKQDTKQPDPTKDPPPIANPKLPTGWGKLGITGDQKKKILAIVAVYQGKIVALEDQVKTLKKEEYQQAYALLNDEQKDTLKKLATKGIDDKKADDKDKKDPPK